MLRALILYSHSTAMALLDEVHITPYYEAHSYLQDKAA